MKRRREQARRKSSCRPGRPSVGGGERASVPPRRLYASCHLPQLFFFFSLCALTFCIGESETRRALVPGPRWARAASKAHELVSGWVIASAGATPLLEWRSPSWQCSDLNTGAQFPWLTPSDLGVKVKVKSLSCVQLFATPWTVAHQAPPPWDSPGKNTGVGCHFLLQRIFPTQGSNPGLPHCRQTLNQPDSEIHLKLHLRKWSLPRNRELWDSLGILTFKLLVLRICGHFLTRHLRRFESFWFLSKEVVWGQSACSLDPHPDLG